MKNKIKSIAIVSSLLLSSAVFAGENFSYSQTKSLVGIEGGYSSLDYENGVRTNNTQGSVSLGNVGLKIGAESEDFRVFLTGGYFFDTSSQYDYLTTYGLAIAYKFNVTEVFNIYLGANGGIMNAKVRAKDSNGVEETFSRTFSDSYVGGDLGANIHLGDSVDLELGGRIMSVQADNTINGVTYRIGNIVQGYGSLIFKWQMD